MQLLLCKHVCLQKNHYTSQHAQLDAILGAAGIKPHATLGYALEHLLGLNHTSQTNHIVSMHMWCVFLKCDL